jgi:hypothetical protein
VLWKPASFAQAVFPLLCRSTGIRQFRQTVVGAAVVVFDAGRLPELVAAFALILKLLPYGKASFGTLWEGVKIVGTMCNEPTQSKSPIRFGGGICTSLDMYV